MLTAFFVVISYLVAAVITGFLGKYADWTDEAITWWAAFAPIGLIAALTSSASKLGKEQFEDWERARDRKRDLR